MDFFGEQDKARKQSFLLLALFFGVMTGFAFVIYVFASISSSLVVSMLTKFLGPSYALWSVNHFSIGLTVALCIIVLIGSWRRYQDVRGGGSTLAARFGATRLDSASGDRPDRQLLDLVIEIALAASIPTPTTFVLRHETSINAFVVGSGNDMALVVSQGALDAFDREQMQGVVGHEFGHLANGDLALNMRLLIALGGLNALDEFGEKTTYFALENSMSRNGRKEGLGYLAIGVFIAGILLRILGSVGVLAGSIIRSSFSRQREFLADASSVQFTRNTYGLASALDRIDQHASGPALHSQYKEELAHLCFQVPVRKNFSGRIFDTHPPIASRIKAIDRHYSVKARKRNKGKSRGRDAAQTTNLATNQAAGQATGQAAGQTAGQITNNNNGLAAVAGSGAIDGGVAGISKQIELFASDQISCQAILHALFVSKQADRAEAYFSAVRFTYNKKFSDKVKNIHSTLGEELDTNKLRIIELIAPTLNKIETENKQRLLNNIEKLVEFDRDNPIENLAAIQVIRRKLNNDTSLSDAVADLKSENSDSSRTRSVSDLGKELSLLLSLMIEAAGYSGERANQDYSRVLKCYTNEHFPLRSAKEDGVMQEIEQAFDALYNQPLVQRQAFVQHCAEIMRSDGISMEEEIKLINLFAASLDVPELAVA